MARPVRTFEDAPALRKSTPLLLGFVGPSGSGKTYSALRMATGIQRVTGGEIYFVDTEANRGLHYADYFRFRHVPFGAPFGPMDYLDVVDHCVRKGAGIIVIDSESHEHDGPGGLLEQHEDAINAGKKDPSAWIELKAVRRRFIHRILQLSNIPMLFCFRAKNAMHWPTPEEKAKGLKDPTRKGWEAIGAEALIYELTAKFLLYPAADGKPCWNPKYDEERETFKRPLQFRELFAQHGQLNEELGEAMARWAAGAPAPLHVPELVARYEACDSLAGLEAIKDDVKGGWKALGKEGREALTAAAEQAKHRLTAAAREPGQDDA